MGDFIKNKQTKIWKEYLEDVMNRLQATRTNNPSYGDAQLDGVWNENAPSKDYLLTAICGTDPNAFCRSPQ